MLNVSSTSGLTVEYVIAIHVTRVRLPGSAIFLLVYKFKNKKEVESTIESYFN